MVPRTDFGRKVNIENKKQKAAETKKRIGPALLNAIGKDKMKSFEEFGIEVDDIRYAALMTGFEQYFRRRENKTILQYRLFNSRQKPGEEQADFMKKLKRLASQCQLASLESGITVQAIIKG